MKKIFICLLLLNSFHLRAQEVTWFEGSVVLSNSKVYIGKVSLEPTYDLILFQHNDSRTVYPAHRIHSVYFYDRDADINRRYVSIREHDDVRASYKLYEVVIPGKVNVLRRKKVRAFSIHADALGFTYYVHYNKAIIPLSKFNRKVYPKLLPTSDKRLEEFISFNRLSASQPANAIRIIQFYNNLVKPDELLVRH